MKLFIFLLLRFKRFFCMLGYQSFIRYVFASIFSLSVFRLLVPLTVSFAEQKFLILMKSNLPIFSRILF